jgi:hypothetical protein
MDSRVGWLLPGGIAYKVGQRDPKRGERLVPYLFGALDGWNYNAGRERAVLGRHRADCEPFVASFASRLPSAAVDEVSRLVAGREPEQGIRTLAAAAVAEGVPITRLEFERFRSLTEGRLTYGRLPHDLAQLVTE